MNKIVLDKTIESPEERQAFIEKQIEEIGQENISPYTRDKIATYLIEVMDLSPRGDVLTPNRMVTINKRETSHEGLVDKLEGGESAFHSLIKEDKNVILTPKVQITEDDVREVPGLAELRKAITEIEARIPSLEGRAKGLARKQLIEMRKDQYVLKNSFRQPIYARSSNNLQQDNIHSAVGLQNPTEVSNILVNYANLKLECGQDMNSDTKWLLEDLDKLILDSLGDKPSLLYILQNKIAGYNNEHIKEGLAKHFGINHTEEYISSLYRNKIPKTIANKATEQWVDFMFMNHLKGEYKCCSRCKKIKLANNRNFSINKTSSSKFYSICKECRNNK